MAATTPPPSKKAAVIKALLLLAANAAALILIYKKLAEGQKTVTTTPADATIDWAIAITGKGKTYTITDWHILLYGALLSFFLLVLFQVILDKQPWNAMFTKQLLIYMIVSFSAIALMCFVAVNWLTAVNPAILVVGGIFVGYLIFRLSQMASGKPEKLP